MAYIPDDALDDAADLSGPAFLLFCQLCRRRNHKQRKVFISLSRMQAILGVSRSSLYRSLAELERKHWTQRNGSEVTITRGNFDPVDKRFYESQKWDEPSQTDDKKSHKMGIDTLSSLPAHLNQPSSPSVAKREDQAAVEEEQSAFQARWDAYGCKKCWDTGLIMDHATKQTHRCDGTRCQSAGARERPRA